jgi:lipopolysaccharide export system protein LptA
MRLLPLLAAAAGLAIGPATRAEDPQVTTVDSVSLESVSTDTETTTVCRDDVVAVGNGMTLHCDYLKVVSTRIGDKSATLGKYGSFRYLLATGHVVIVQGDRVATCGRAEVFPGEDRIVLTEGPVVEIKSEGYKVSGPRMVLYRGQRRAVVEGTPSERSHISLPPIKDLGFPSDKPAPSN